MTMRWLELLPLVLIALIFFGPKRLPEMGASIGKTIREFQKSIREVTGGIEDAVRAPEKPAASTLPPAAPLAAVAREQETATATTAATTPAAEPVSASAAQPDADS
jgi:sec-independent protein translocase protein TatA